MGTLAIRPAKCFLNMPGPVICSPLMFLAISTHPPSAGNRKASVPVAERLGELERDRDRELRIGRQKLDKLERQIPHLIDFIADGGRSPGLAEKLRGLENEAESERARTAALAKQSVAAIPLPAPDDLMELVFDLEKRLLRFYHETKISKEIVDLFHGVQAAFRIAQAALKNPVSRGCHYRRN